ncbi:MAG: hypothetical protein AAGG44_08500 [Planctomycetota bacterium]
MNRYSDYDDYGYDEDFGDEEWDDSADEGWDDDETSTVPCPFCKREIYEEAIRCPYCDQYVEGLSSPKPSQPTWVLWTAVLLLVLFALGYLRYLL